MQDALETIVSSSEGSILKLYRASKFVCILKCHTSVITAIYSSPAESAHSKLDLIFVVPASVTSFVLRIFPSSRPASELTGHAPTRHKSEVVPAQLPHLQYREAFPAPQRKCIVDCLLDSLVCEALHPSSAGFGEVSPPALERAVRLSRRTSHNDKYLLLQSPFIAPFHRLSAHKTMHIRRTHQ